MVLGRGWKFFRSRGEGSGRGLGAGLAFNQLRRSSAALSVLRGPAECRGAAVGCVVLVGLSLVKIFRVPIDDGLGFLSGGFWCSVGLARPQGLNLSSRD
jgi:hypothetical protein